MITINLLPPEEREAPPTSAARLLVVAASVLIALVAVVFYGMTHYIDLPNMQTALGNSQKEFREWNAKQIPQRHTEAFQVAGVLKKREDTIENIRLLKSEMARKLTEYAEIIDTHGRSWSGDLHVKKDDVAGVRRQPLRGPIIPTSTVTIPTYQWAYKAGTASDNFQIAIDYYKAIQNHTSFWRDFVGIKTPEYDLQEEDAKIFKPHLWYQFNIQMTMKMDRKQK
ncbi:hypothetical protein [Candidatus Uabimicrobium sp. HlEnr_7]|uniref:hypothetical protein n=1 Tax=Candidatus Uabimicrobium helgolandensis TaxID=3095367 RepID=UPI0035570AF9